MRKRKTIGALCFVAVMLLTMPLFAGCGAPDNGDVGGDWRPELLGKRSPEALANHSYSMAFTVISDGNTDIYLRQADGGNRIKLTSNSYRAQNLTWSPDGAKIAFVSSHNSIQVIDVDGTKQTTLGNGVSPAWSPDGSKIAFAYGNSGREIYVVDADGTDETQLTNVYTFTASDNSGLSRGKETRASSPVWSADGTQIMFYKETWDIQQPWSSIGVWGPESSEAWVMNADGTDQHKFDDENSFTASTPYPSRPSWMSGKALSLDGTRMVYSNVAVVGSRIWVSDADGTGEEWRTDNDRVNRNPSWSADGIKIAYTSRDSYGGNTELWVMNADGTDKVRITEESEDCISYAWSPVASDLYGTGFGIYLDSGELVIGDEHIAAYDLDTHIIELNEAGIEQWNSLMIYADYGIPRFSDKLRSKDFVVGINGKEIYRGHFFFSYALSSSMPRGVHIQSTITKLSSSYSTIAIHYYDIFESSGDDPRNAPEIVEFFTQN